MENKNDNNKAIEGKLILIIDSISFFYEIGQKSIYLLFDYKSFIEYFEKLKHYYYYYYYYYYIYLICHNKNISINELILKIFCKIFIKLVYQFISVHKRFKKKKTCICF